MSEYKNHNPEISIEEIKNDIKKDIAFMSVVILNTPLFKNTLHRIDRAIENGEENGIDLTNEKIMFEKKLRDLLPTTTLYIISELSKYLDGRKKNDLITESNDYTLDDWIKTAQDIMNEAQQRGYDIRLPQAKFNALKKVLYSLPEDETETIQK